jgi:hypothetical protein
VAKTRAFRSGVQYAQVVTTSAALQRLSTNPTPRLRPTSKRTLEKIRCLIRARVLDNPGTRNSIGGSLSHVKLPFKGSALYMTRLSTPHLPAHHTAQSAGRIFAYLHQSQTDRVILAVAILSLTHFVRDCRLTSISWLVTCVAVWFIYCEHVSAIPDLGDFLDRGGWSSATLFAGRPF